MNHSIAMNYLNLICYGNTGTTNFCTFNHIIRTAGTQKIEYPELHRYTELKLISTPQPTYTKSSVNILICVKQNLREQDKNRMWYESGPEFLSSS